MKGLGFGVSLARSRVYGSKVWGSKLSGWLRQSDWQKSFAAFGVLGR